MRDIILTKEALDDVVAYFSKYDEFVFDIESTGEHRGVPSQNQVLWISMSTYGRTVVIPMGHPNGSRLISKATWRKNKLTGERENFPAVFDDPPEQLRPSVVWKALEPLFFSNRRKIAHGAMMDFGSVAKYYGGRIPPRPHGCSLLAGWLLDENRLKGLKPLVDRFYKHKYDNEGVGKCVEKHPFNTVARYAWLDSKWAWLLWRKFSGQIVAEKFERLMGLELKLLDALLHFQGAPVDKDRLIELEHELVIKQEEIKTRLFRAAGKLFNVNSSQQRQDILFGKKKDGGQGLKPFKLTDGGKKKKRAGIEITFRDFSTDAETLEKYPENDVCRILLEYAEVDKLLSTYVRAYLGHDGQPSIIFGGRIYPQFQQYGARTGRFSCASPNLQNVPRPGTELGTATRGLFIAPEGCKLLVADYGQIELRVLAHYLGRGALYDGFIAGVDAHTATAALVFGVAWEDVTKEQRQIAKGLNFAIVYGAGPETVAAMAGITLAQAKKIMAKHEREFPEIYRLREAVIERARNRDVPHITTLMGRKRRIPELRSKLGWLRAKAERQIFNALIQGSSADLIKLAIVRLHESIQATPEADGIAMTLTVHDELVVICPEEKVELGSRLLQDAMIGEGIKEFVRVPLTADVAVCDRWSDAKD